MRIVLCCWGSYGDLFPYLGLARCLRALGHTPVIAACPFYADLVRREGIEFRPLRPDVDPTNQEVIARVMDPRRGSEVVLRELIAPAVRDGYADLTDAARGADVIVSHPVTFAAPIVADEQKIPWISTVLSPISFFSVYDFPVLPALPGAALLTRLHPSISRLFLRLARRMTRSWMEPVRALRAELGLPSRGDPLYEGQFSPHGTLALFSRVLGAPQPDWPRRTTQTGFIFDNQALPMPEDLSMFLDAGDPPIVFTLGSSAIGVAGRFYEESIQAANMLGQRAVLLIGKPENLPSTPLPAGIIAVETAPHDVVFPRASAIVHQCGMGTTGQALRAGRPMLLVPYAHDQPDNAYRLCHLGVARALFPKRYTALRVASHLRALLDDARYAARSAQMAREVRAEGGVDKAAEVILELGTAGN